MTQGTWNIDNGPLRGFYRDRENGWIFGVCAGLADRFNLNLGMVRILALVSLLIFSWLTIALYIGATLLVREKPLIYSGRDNEYEFWRRRREDHWRHS
jgi:phage shock protein C